MRPRGGREIESDGAPYAFLRVPSASIRWSRLMSREFASLHAFSAILAHLRPRRDAGARADDAAPTPDKSTYTLLQSDAGGRHARLRAGAAGKNPQSLYNRCRPFPDRKRLSQLHPQPITPVFRRGFSRPPIRRSSSASRTRSISNLSSMAIRIPSRTVIRPAPSSPTATVSVTQS